MMTLSHQSWLRIFTNCFPVLRDGIDNLIPVKGEDMFNICHRSLPSLLEMTRISRMCDAMLAFNVLSPP